MGLSYRNVEKALKYHGIHVSHRTTHDLVVQGGIEIQTARHAQRAEILKANGFDPCSGLPVDPAKVQEQLQTVPAVMPCSEAIELLKQHNAECREKGINETKNLIFAQHLTKSMEESAFIELDEVGTKHQSDIKHIKDLSTKRKRKKKLSRRAAMHANKLAAKKRESRRCAKAYQAELNTPTRNDVDKATVQHSVALISWLGDDGKDHKLYLTESSVPQLLLSVKACLLDNNLLFTRHLSFHTDGARNLKTEIDRAFGFCSYSLLLDWYHLDHRIYSLLSMALAGDLRTKRTYKAEVSAQLWVGNYRKAISILESFKQRGIVRNIRRLDEAIQYIKGKASNLTSYSLHKAQGRKNSSSGAEKANDLIVANRQKHRGMSWTLLGGVALANVAWAMLNGQLENFVKGTGSLRWYQPCANNEFLSIDAA